MKLAQSRLTAQGQISVPAEVRRRLGLSPGSVLDWEADGESIFVRRGGVYTSEQIHQVLFASRPEPRTLRELKAGIETYVRARHARR